MVLSTLNLKLILYNLALSFMPYVGVKVAKVLINTLATVSSVFECSKQDLIKIKDVSYKLAGSILSTLDKAIVREQGELNFVPENIWIAGVFLIETPAIQIFSGTARTPL